MQRQFTIELRVDFSDNEKMGLMKTACQIAARHMLAQAALIKDAVNPQIAVYADDFFSGHQEIALFDDVLGQGIEMVGTAGADEEVSPELLAAIAGGDE